jgi:hypothetical protein
LKGVKIYNGCNTIAFERNYWEAKKMGFKKALEKAYSILSFKRNMSVSIHKNIEEIDVYPILIVSKSENGSVSTEYYED